MASKVTTELTAKENKRAIYLSKRKKFHPSYKTSNSLPLIHEFWDILSSSMIAYKPLKLKVNIAMKVTIQAKYYIMGKFMLFASTSISCSL